VFREAAFAVSGGLSDSPVPDLYLGKTCAATTATPRASRSLCRRIIERLSGERSPTDELWPKGRGTHLGEAFPTVADGQTRCGLSDVVTST
jgi:hypothetical protein